MNHEILKYSKKLNFKQFFFLGKQRRLFTSNNCPRQLRNLKKKFFSSSEELKNDSEELLLNHSFILLYKINWQKKKSYNQIRRRI